MSVVQEYAMIVFMWECGISVISLFDLALVPDINVEGDVSDQMKYALNIMLWSILKAILSTLLEVTHFIKKSVQWSSSWFSIIYMLSVKFTKIHWKKYIMLMYSWCTVWTKNKVRDILQSYLWCLSICEIFGASNSWTSPVTHPISDICCPWGVLCEYIAYGWTWWSSFLACWVTTLGNTCPYTHSQLWPGPHTYCMHALSLFPQPN